MLRTDFPGVNWTGEAIVGVPRFEGAMPGLLGGHLQVAAPSIAGEPWLGVVRWGSSDEIEVRGPDVAAVVDAMHRAVEQLALVIMRPRRRRWRDPAALARDPCAEPPCEPVPGVPAPLLAGFTGLTWAVVEADGEVVAGPCYEAAWPELGAARIQIFPPVGAGASWVAQVDLGSLGRLDASAGDAGELVDRVHSDLRALGVRVLRAVLPHWMW